MRRIHSQRAFVVASFVAALLCASDGQAFFGLCKRGCCKTAVPAAAAPVGPVAPAAMALAPAVNATTRVAQYVPETYYRAVVAGPPTSCGLCRMLKPNCLCKKKQQVQYVPYTSYRIVYVDAAPVATTSMYAPATAVYENPWSRLHGPAVVAAYPTAGYAVTGYTATGYAPAVAPAYCTSGACARPVAVIPTTAAMPMTTSPYAAYPAAQIPAYTAPAATSGYAAPAYTTPAYTPSSQPGATIPANSYPPTNYPAAPAGAYATPYATPTSPYGAATTPYGAAGSPYNAPMNAPAAVPGGPYGAPPANASPSNAPAPNYGPPTAQPSLRPIVPVPPAGNASPAGAPSTAPQSAPPSTSPPTVPTRRLGPYTPPAAAPTEEPPADDEPAAPFIPNTTPDVPQYDPADEVDLPASNEGPQLLDSSDERTTSRDRRRSKLFSTAARSWERPPQAIEDLNPQRHTISETSADDRAVPGTAAARRPALLGEAATPAEQPATSNDGWRPSKN